MFFKSILLTIIIQSFRNLFNLFLVSLNITISSATTTYILIIHRLIIIYLINLHYYYTYQLILLTFIIKIIYYMSIRNEYWTFLSPRNSKISSFAILILQLLFFCIDYRVCYLQLILFKNKFKKVSYIFRVIFKNIQM